MAKKEIIKQEQSKVGMITFKVRNVEFGLNIFHVKEIINYIDITKAPLLSNGVIGMISLRGVLFPVLDLKYIFYNEPTNLQDLPLMMVTETGGQRQVLLVDSVDAIIELAFKDIHQKELMSSSDTPLIMGMYDKGEGKLISCLHLENLLAKINPMSHEETIAPNSCNATVLIVDDSNVARKHLMSGLTSGGVTCILAESGKQALHLLDSPDIGHIDVILTDAEMPEMDGFDLIGNIKVLTDYKDTPIIMYSGLSDLVSEKRAISVGAKTFVHKYDLPKLVDAIKSYL